MVSCLNKTEFQQKTPKITITDIVRVFDPLLFRLLFILIHFLSKTFKIANLASIYHKYALTRENDEMDQNFENLVF